MSGGNWAAWLGGRRLGTGAESIPLGSRTLLPQFRNPQQVVGGASEHEQPLNRLMI